MATQRYMVTVNAVNFQQRSLPHWDIVDDISPTSWRGQAFRGRRVLLDIIKPLSEQNNTVRVAQSGKQPIPFFGEPPAREYRQRQNLKTINQIAEENMMRRQQIAKEQSKYVHYDYKSEQAGGIIGRANREEQRNAYSRLKVEDKTHLFQTDEGVQIAVLEQPPFVTGTSPALYAEIKRQRLQKLYGPELLEIAKAQEDCDKLDEIIDISKETVQSELKAVAAPVGEPVTVRASEAWA